MIETITQKKRVLSLLLSIIMTFLPATALSVFAASTVSYIECSWDGTRVVQTTKSVSDYTTVTSDMTTWSAGWYVASGEVTINSRVTVSGDVFLVLTDGAHLNATKGITVNGGNSITIYAQSDGASVGKLTAGRSANSANIGGTGYISCGTVTIHGGTINASTDKAYGAAIGGGLEGAGGTVTIYGGTVTAKTGSSGAGIGGGREGSGGTVTINGGTVSATGGGKGAGIGGGESDSGGTVTINGGTVSAKGGSNGAGIGGGYFGSGGTVTINGGTVSAKGGSNGAGIGGGSNRGGGTVTINGGTVSATGGNGSAGIGGGIKGSGGTVTINGGTVSATGGEYGAGVGGGNNRGGGAVTINGGTVSATGGEYGASVGGGFRANGGTVTINGGNVNAVAGSGAEAIGKGRSGSSSGTLTDGNGNSVSLNTFIINGAAADTAVTRVTGVTYGITDVQTLDTGKLYFYLPSGANMTGVTAGGVEYPCNRSNTFYTDHSGDAPTCSVAPACTFCGAEFQEKNPTVHVSEETYYAKIDDTNHGIYYVCCDGLKETEAHTEGTAATCTGQGICSVCNMAYGETNGANHAGSLVWVQENSYHTQKWSCCGAVEIPRTWHTPEFATAVTNEDGSVSLSAACAVCEKDLGTETYTAPNVVYDGEIHKISCTGDIYCCTGDNTLYAAYYNANGKLINNYVVGGYKGGVTAGGEYKVVIQTSGGKELAELEFIIAPKELTISGVYVHDKAYDGTAEAHAYSLEFEGGVDGDELFAGIDGDVVFSGSTVGEYTTVTGITAARAFLSTIAERYGDNYVVVGVDSTTEYPIIDSAYINKRTLYITAENQSITEDGELDQTAYTVENLLDGYELSGIALSYYDTTIYVDTENAVVTNADGEDVTSNFEFYTYDGILSVSCESHYTNGYGFCATGDCNSYALPEYELDEYDNKIYTITNAGELYWFANYVNNYDSYICGKLANDIEIPDSYMADDGETPVEVPDWTPIGDYSSYNSYNGSFDGCGYTISGLCVNNSEQSYVGLFGNIGYNPEIKNIHIANSTFIGNNYVGALAGYAEAWVYGCSVADTVTVGGNTTNVGGMIGNAGGELTNSYSLAQLQGGNTAGLVGYSYTAVSNCYTNASKLFNSQNSSYGGSVTNSYYCSDTDDGNGGKTAEQFASGEVAYLLQSGNTEQVWGQDNNQAGAFPVFDSTGLYKVVPVGETGNYSVANIGDINADETVDVTDYQALVNKALADNHTQIETVAYDNIIRYDIDGDGYLDVIDASLMHLVINGFSTVDVYAIGDYDCNGKAFEEADLKLIKHAIENPEKLSTAEKYASDINGDGKLSKADLTALTDIYGEIADTFCEDNIKVYYS